MALTLSDLRTRLNLRTGDPNGDFLSTSERDMIINDAARKVASDLYRNGTALLTDRKKIQLEPNVTEYALPDDLIGVQEVFWEDSSTRHEVEQRPLQSFKDIDRTGDRPVYFDVFGQAADVLLTTYAAHDTYIDDSVYDDHSIKVSGYRDSSGTLVNTAMVSVAVGDLLYNLTDNSSGTITKITPDGSSPSNYYFTCQLSGGESNFAKYGDKIQIERAQKTKPLLHVYPKPTDSATVETVQSGTISDWLANDVHIAVRTSNRGTTSVPAIQGGTNGTSPPSVSDVEPFVLYGIRVSGGSPDGRRVSLGINEITRGDANWTSVSREVDDQYFRRVNDDDFLIKPISTAHLSDKDGESYTADATAYEFSFTTGDSTLTGAKYEILKLKGAEQLIVYYAKYPNRLGEDGDISESTTDQLELPEIAMEALLLHAEYEVHLKAEGGRNNLSSQAYALYEMELQKILKFLRTRNVRGSRTVRNIMYGKSLRYG